MQFVLEIWKDIEGYEGLYKVSNFGKVKTYTKEFILTNRRGAEIPILRFEREMAVRSKRYRRAALSKDRKVKHFSVHRLTALAFIPNPDNLPEVNHIDGNKLNCHVYNLEWSTHENNVQHAHDTGLINRDNVGKHRIGIMPHGTKEILDLNTGIYYESVKAAERAAGITPNTLRAYLRDNSRYKTSESYRIYNSRFKILNVI